MMTPPPDRDADFAELVDALVGLDERLRAGETSDVLGDTDHDGLLADAAPILKFLQELPSLTGAATAPDLPKAIGRYEVRGIAGSGGFAVVYRGYDPQMRRDVAVKVPHRSRLHLAEIRARFLLEARALSRLDHPHIVPTYEAGLDAGVPYLVCAYCTGPTLARHLEEVGVLEPPLAAELVRQLADALEHSHQRGIWHRDLKPSNVLLFPSRHASSGDFPYVPRVSDFGLARVLEADVSTMTQSGAAFGTPRYLAPEQLASRHRDVGPATDVYGLGTILYECLTGQPPFDGDTTWDILAKIAELSPAAPRLIKPSIPRDLETITLTCLAKDPADRYGTARDLSADLQRFLSGQPIRAMPTPLWRKFWMWCDRHRAIAGLSGVVVASVIMLVCALALYLVQTTHLSQELANKNVNLSETVRRLDTALTDRKAAQELAEDRATELQEALYSIEVARAADAWRRGDVRTMVAALKPFAAQPELQEFGWRFLWRQQATRELFREELGKPQYFARFSADGREVAFAGADAVVRVYSAPDFRLRKEWATGQREVNGLEFDPAGQWLATSGDDGTVAVWSLSTGERLNVYPLFKDRHAYQVGYSSELGWLVACGNDSSVHRVDMTSGEVLPPYPEIHSRSVEFLAISPDGRRVLSGGTDGEAAIWELSTGKIQHRLGGLDLTVSAGAWSRDGKEVVVAAHDGQISLWNAETGKLMASQDLFDRPQSLAINPAGLILVGDRGGAVTVYSRRTRPEDESVELQRVTKWQLHQDRVYGLAASPVDSRIASASRDKTVAVTELQLRHAVTHYFAKGFEYHPIYRSVAGPDQFDRTYRTTPDGIAIFAPGADANYHQFLPRRNLQDVVLHGQTLLAVSGGNLLQWKIGPELGEPVESRILEDGSLHRVEFLNDEQILLQCSTVEVRLWNLRTRQVDHVWPGRHWLAVSPDRSQFVLAENADKRLTLYDAKTLHPVWMAAGHTEPIKAIVFDPRGKSVISGSDDRSIRRWDLATGRERMQFHNHEKPVFLLAVSPDGRTLASADLKFSIRLWDLRSGRPLFELHHHDDEFQMLEFSDDGDELWAIDRQRFEHRWSCRPFDEE